MLGEKGTEDYLKCLGANDPIIQRGHDQRMHLMLAGDHMVTGRQLSIQRACRSNERTRARLTPWCCRRRSSPLPASSRSTAMRQHPNAAALYAEWLMSPESQQYIASQLRGPVILHHPFIPDDAEIVTTIVRRRTRWRGSLGTGINIWRRNSPRCAISLRIPRREIACAKCRAPRLRWSSRRRSCGWTLAADRFRVSCETPAAPPCRSRSSAE